MRQTDWGRAARYAGLWLVVIAAWSRYAYQDPLKNVAMHSPCRSWCLGYAVASRRERELTILGKRRRRLSRSSAPSMAPGYRFLVDTPAPLATSFSARTMPVKAGIGFTGCAVIRKTLCDREWCRICGATVTVDRLLGVGQSPSSNVRFRYSQAEMGVSLLGMDFLARASNPDSGSRISRASCAGD